MMDLRHYASAPVTLDARVHEQDKGLKPNGLWLSVGSEWLDWCRGEEFRADLDWYEHVVTLTEDTNLLHLGSGAELDRFTNDYGVQVSPKFDSRYIDWARVAREYDGIVIAPYQWSRRLAPHTFWYYGWDIASGCIWNAAAVNLSAGFLVQFVGVRP